MDAVHAGARPNLRVRWWSVRPPAFGNLLKRLVVSGHSAPVCMNNAIKVSAQRVIPGPGAAHATATPIMNSFPADHDSNVKFCIATDPYDPVVSDYFWRLNRLKRARSDGPTFREYLIALIEEDSLNGFCPRLPDNWPIYTIHDRIVVDDVVFFERPVEGLRSVIIAQLGLNGDCKLTSAKRSKRATHYREMSGHEERQLVRRAFRQQIESFDYSFWSKGTIPHGQCSKAGGTPKAPHVTSRH